MDLEEAISLGFIEDEPEKGDDCGCYDPQCPCSGAKKPELAFL